MSFDQVQIEVPSSSANLGIGFDTWCIGLSYPNLKVTLRKLKEGKGIKIINKSPYKDKLTENPYEHSGAKALEFLFEKLKVKDYSLQLTFEDTDYPPAKGLGRSGAEAVGSVLCGIISYSDLKDFDRKDIVLLSSYGEAGSNPKKGIRGHLDNVSGSTNGGFNIISKNALQEVRLYHFLPKENLGVAIGYSDYEKKGGTEALRKILNRPIRKEDYVKTIARISSATFCLLKGDVDGFLEMVWEDLFHEVRRADGRGYGNFDSKELLEFKRYLFTSFGIALNISGAGPNIQILYNKDRVKDWKEIENTLKDWFLKRGIGLVVKRVDIAKEGAYDKALKMLS
ncbi:MAG: hypothetical protein QXX95_08040 [Nitrososphaerales archaeon]